MGRDRVKARLVDAIVELTETGTSLRANNLRIIDTVIVSTTRLIANRQAWEDDFKERRSRISLSCSRRRSRRAASGVKMNVRKEDLDAVLKVLPGRRVRRCRAWRTGAMWRSR